MSSLNQLISEIAHSVQQADSIPVRRAIRQAIIHARNELIRHSYSNHNYTDKVLKQRFNLKIEDIENDDLRTNVKFTINKVHKPVRFTNNLPFHSVIAHGEDNELVIPFVSEGAAKYYKRLPGMCKGISYDYINGRIYIRNLPDNIDTITVESVFEYPHEVAEDYTNDNDEFFLPEDLVNAVKKLTLETFNVQIVRDTNEIPNPNLLK